MKLLKYTLIVASLIVISPLNAKRTGATQIPTYQPTQPIFTPQPQRQPQPKPQQQPTRKPTSYSNYKELLDYVRTLQPNEIFNSNGFLTDDIIQFLSHVRKNLTYNLARALSDAVLFKHMQWTEDFENDQKKIDLIAIKGKLLEFPQQPRKISKPQTQQKESIAQEKSILERVFDLTAQEAQIIEENINNREIQNILDSISSHHFALLKNETDQQRMNRLIEVVKTQLRTRMREGWGKTWSTAKRQSVGDYIESDFIKAEITPLINKKIQKLQQ